MESRLTVFDVFKGCLMLIAGFFIAYFGAFFATMTGSIEEYAYPQAYGRTTLQPKTDGIGTVLVWQKNYKPFAGSDVVTINHERLSNSKDFYFQLELPMVPGNAMLPYAQVGDESPEWAVVPRIIPEDGFTPSDGDEKYSVRVYGEDYARGYTHDFLPHYPFSIVYTGLIRGHLDVAPSKFYYEANRDTVPGHFSGEDYIIEESLYTTDGTFESKGVITVSVPAISVDCSGYYNGTSNLLPQEYCQRWLENYHTSDDFEFDDFFALETFADIYPGSPEILWEFERVVLTRRLSFELYSPSNSDVCAASGVIMIKTYGIWQKRHASPAEINAITHYGYKNEEYTEFVVEKYTQSEMHSLK
ncbi:MAG: hypothetical protein IJY35_00600 [Clostridia bacterium]|nr:hypothetical protein [Clostridia bacterium]